MKFYNFSILFTLTLKGGKIFPFPFLFNLNVQARKVILFSTPSFIPMLFVPNVAF